MIDIKENYMLGTTEIKNKLIQKYDDDNFVPEHKKSNRKRGARNIITTES